MPDEFAESVHGRDRSIAWDCPCGKASLYIEGSVTISMRLALSLRCEACGRRSLYGDEAGLAAMQSATYDAVEPLEGGPR